MTKMFDPRADLFFEDPGNDPNLPRENRYGILYLLRRDIYNCFGWDPTEECKICHKTLWPGAMAILAGIDLLAKFYKGNDKHRRVGRRYRGFVSKYFELDLKEDKETIYQLRNSLIHSFGLYSETGEKKYRFVLTEGGDTFVQMDSDGRYQVDLIVLHWKFEEAIGKYIADLNNYKCLQKKFIKMFPNYGAIEIRKIN